MRLLFVTQDFPPDVGGIQTYAAALAPRLASRCDAFAVVAPRQPRAAAVDAALPFPVHRWPARPDLLLLPALIALPALARRFRCDVALHAQWSTAPASLGARRLTGFPRRVAVAAHGRELLFNPFASDPAFLQRAYDGLRRRTLTRADSFFPVSRYTQGLLQQSGANERRCTVVPNGTDPARFAPGGASALRRRLGLGTRPALLTVGRLVPRKGVDTMLRALPRIAQAVPDVRYLVAGKGPDRARLEALARRLGVASRVRFLGAWPPERLRALYAAADVFVMPSREAPPDVEGFGIVFLEASACGTPVVGARAGGIPDAVAHGESGLLVPPAAPAALAEACLQLLRDPERARRLGRQGRQRVLRRFTWDRVADSLFDSLSASAACTSS